MTPESPAEAPGAVVARVNGEPIVRAQVERLCEASGLSPKQALERLVNESLLAQYAQERGYGELGSVQRELKRARVRALLAQEVERGTEPAAFEPAQVHARAAQRRAPNETSAGAVQALSAEEEAHIRNDLSLEARRARFEALLREIREREFVAYDEQTIRSALTAEVALATGT